MPSTQQSELLEISELKCHYDTPEGSVKAVDMVSFRLAKGECLCIVGESGSGKSTLALSILRLLESPPARLAGEVKFEGRDLLKLGEKDLRRVRGREIAMIFQDPQSSLNPVLKVGGQIVEQIEEHTGMGKDEARERAIKLLEEVGIPSPREMVDGYPHQFSGGMRQRAIIAMALSCCPELIIADEPTSALDVTIQAQILDIFRKLITRGISILFITHDLGIAAEIADRIVVMYAGKIMERGTTLEIFEGPVHPYTRGLLDCLPVSAREGELPFIPGTIPSLVHPPRGCVFHPRCSYSFKPCTREAPPEYTISQTHSAACHLCSGYKEGGR